MAITGFISQPVIFFRLSIARRSSGLARATVRDFRCFDRGSIIWLLAKACGMSFSRASSLDGFNDPSFMDTNGMSSCLARALARSSSFAKPLSTNISPMVLPLNF